VNDIGRNSFQRPGEHAEDIWLGNWIENQGNFFPFNFFFWFRRSGLLINKLGFIAF
jgi:hypothetical protein